MTRPQGQGGSETSSNLLFHQYPSCAPINYVGLALSQSSPPLLLCATNHVNNMHFVSSSTTTNIMDEHSFFPPPPQPSSSLQSLSRQSSSRRESFQNQGREGIRRNTVVHFSKILQIREVQHRKDMSPMEFQERWDIGARVLPAISRSIFDEHVLVLNPQDYTDCSSSFSSSNSSSSSSSCCNYKKEEKDHRDAMKRRRRRDAYLIRRKVLSDMADYGSRRRGQGEAGDHDDNDDDHDLLASIVARKYSQNSEQNVREAHIAALKHAHEVAVLDDDGEEQEDHFCSSFLSTAAARKDNDQEDACHDHSTKQVALLPSLSSSSSSLLPPSGRGLHHQQHSKGKRVGSPGNHPLAAVKRLRNTT